MTSESAELSGVEGASASTLRGGTEGDSWSGVCSVWVADECMGRLLWTVPSLCQVSNLGKWTTYPANSGPKASPMSSGRAHCVRYRTRIASNSRRRVERSEMAALGVVVSGVDTGPRKSKAGDGDSNDGCGRDPADWIGGDNGSESS